MPRQQIIAGKMRLAAKVHRVMESRHARLEPFVAPLAKLDHTARLNRSPRQVAHTNRIAIDRQHNGLKPAIRATRIAQPSEQEGVIELAIQP